MREYKPVLTASVNRKGVLDVDTVKGCSYGMGKYPDGGCYGLCYACKTAVRYGYDFTKSVKRVPWGENVKSIENIVSQHHAPWFRIGVMGDPSFDWRLTVSVCAWLSKFKIPVVITKHWIALSDAQMKMLRDCGTVVNTSTSPLDTENERKYRVAQFHRLSNAGVMSVLRVVSCDFGGTPMGRELAGVQRGLFNEKPIIDNPLRIPRTDRRVVEGHINTVRIRDMRGMASISLHDKDVYVGTCLSCPDQCGVALFKGGC